MATDGAFIDAYDQSLRVKQGTTVTDGKRGRSSMPTVQQGERAVIDETSQPVRPPKMVVGRKALAGLAANSAAAAVQGSFVQATAAPPAMHRSDEPDVDAEARSSVAFDEHEIVELSAIPRAPEGRRYRLHRKDPREYVPDATSSKQATEVAYESFAVPAASLSPCTTQEEPSILRPELEVDNFCWPLLCERLISARRHDVRRVADKIEQQASANANVIAVASAQAREGCTTLLLCLARLLAEGARTICLVDANMARPELASQLGLCPEFGWEQMVRENRSPAEALIESKADRITVLPLLGSNSGDCLEHLKKHGAISALRSTFDLVLIDAGAIVSANSMTTESEAVLKLADACLLVKKEASGSRWTEHACRKLEEWKIQLIGLVENRCQA
jgi:Mrp family chromosome partitioning ATPase